jgi:NitT/TauT family transport system substrate-binding protein
MSKCLSFAPLAAAIGLGFSLIVGSLAAPTVAHAEGEIRIAEQFGIVYLLLNVVRDQNLIEKYGKQEGIDIKVDWTQLSGGAAVNDALLSGSIDIAGAGVGPLLTIWDRTHGKQNVKAVASLGNFPYYLVSNNPKVKTIADFTEKDRIAVPAVGVSVQSRVLQLASAKLWGDKEFAKLDKISVAVPHPDAAAAIIKGGTEITGHFGNPPFQEQELAGNPQARIVLNSYQVLGGPASATVLYATEKFRAENPKTYQAFVEALNEAAQFVTANPEKAADIYIKVSNAKIDRDLLLKIIKNPEVQFKTTPQNTYQLAEFMHRVGAIKNKPASVKDYFFDDAQNAAGN